jgi:hypothetical protein
MRSGAARRAPENSESSVQIAEGEGDGLANAACVLETGLAVFVPMTRFIKRRRDGGRPQK